MRQTYIGFCNYCCLFGRRFSRQISLIVGLMYATVGALRLGFLTNFLSRSVIAGFTCGAALVIGVSQASDPRKPRRSKPEGIYHADAYVMIQSTG